MKREDLLTESYDYELPEELIAQRPAPERDHSKLMVYKHKSDSVEHSKFHHIADFLPKDTLLVLNQSKVFPCRLMGKKPTGGKAEVLFLSLLHEGGLYPVMLKTSGKKKLGDVFLFGELKLKIEKVLEDGSFYVQTNLEGDDLLDYLEDKAQIPIPPYIREGVADENDVNDYQTVYAKHAGSVAAPTAGLHFTNQVFDSLKEKGIDIAKVTLHVGAGTFKPVSADEITDHKMHSEHFDISEEDLEKLNNAKNIFAVGTTTLRVLESCYKDGKFALPEEKSTDIFLYPGKEVKSIQGLITNFHLPKSTLLMLVSSIVGREKTLSLYKTAVEEKYRFFSYGDSMMIMRNE
ncbi:MAG: tRNA preQ1(34) S-adenosylmethionine ribosyltransferase-isomerase QueA [Halobacteriovoraceae bacterium]|nr:tRNA preQ1(34) S-adenosylmethionine ribosyltransferase-isomerase QueA [Halobacteriovoraceae bacterium]|tara:strand:+ start:37100 stop:38143 length:1044 start_codon:yes stop_codon:yes gene_type:complete